MITDPQAMFALSKLLTERNAAFLELDAARADLREALSLLRDNGDVRMFVFRADMAREVSRWARRCDALLARHKETP